jgi:hypothetical protein
MNLSPAEPNEWSKGIRDSGQGGIRQSRRMHCWPAVFFTPIMVYPIGLNQLSRVRAKQAIINPVIMPPMRPDTILSITAPMMSPFPISTGNHCSANIMVRQFL